MIEVRIVVHPNDRRAQALQPLRLGLHRVLALLEGGGPTAAHGDVEMKPVLHSLLLRHLLEPEPRSITVTVDDAIVANLLAELLLRKAPLAPIIGPGSTTVWRCLD